MRLQSPADAAPFPPAVSQAFLRTRQLSTHTTRKMKMALAILAMSAAGLVESIKTGVNLTLPEFPRDLRTPQNMLSAMPGMVTLEQQIYVGVDSPSDVPIYRNMRWLLSPIPIAVSARAFFYQGNRVVASPAFFSRFLEGRNPQEAQVVLVKPDDKPVIAIMVRRSDCHQSSRFAIFTKDLQRNEDLCEKVDTYFDATDTTPYHYVCLEEILIRTKHKKTAPPRFLPFVGGRVKVAAVQHACGMEVGGWPSVRVVGLDGQGKDHGIVLDTRDFHGSTATEFTMWANAELNA